MIRAIKNRWQGRSPAMTIIACVVLVLAVACSGVAGAAATGLIKWSDLAPGIQKKLKAKAKPGAPGKDGQNGQNGLNGIGKDGKDGAAGNGILANQFSGVKGPCTEGGVELVGYPDPKGGPTYVCNGAEGEEGPEPPEPPGVTVTEFSGAQGPCTEGGTKFVSDNSTAYACNGKKGKDGADGKDGAGLTAIEFSGAQGPCTEGGAKFVVGAETVYACNGTKGAKGEKGDKGDPGEDQFGNWGPIFRNTIPSAFMMPMSLGGALGIGPPLNKPPFGHGGLVIGVNDVPGKVEKAAWGNEVDFTGVDPTTYNRIGYHIFQTGENCGFNGTVCTKPGNLPNLTFEIDPNVGGASNAIEYSSLVYVPSGVPVINQWSGEVDATLASSRWYFTNGTLATQTNCSQIHYCNWTEIKVALNDAGNPAAAAILTFAVSKGRDELWFGAVDGLRLNNVVYDIESNGVFEKSP